MSQKTSRLTYQPMTAVMDFFYSKLQTQMKLFGENIQLLIYSQKKLEMNITHYTIRKCLLRNGELIIGANFDNIEYNESNISKTHCPEHIPEDLIDAWKD
ncbi:hypothetical protein RhiirA1_447726 [Rhizophagus irregularis]|uniref:Uncharacterized protein n=3 Tax=Rhizophagus irregularis TaxID=588596 RepID=U9SGY6_RHIID|nr:hypothetical protein GLOIN_2v1763124 [Rhizophagus irregularis DAOM 181602=DAOM 197198]PKC76307.1 hypothetical protein RhiirA1_447726 [Rhizophagus irregularis]POG81550.1 hypothetical protein GLOIN_2v1763124 [Rhizophagus irregularis DAOM 181602=DAOM 197198]CAB4480343.1 unnamed protein product [Rhizophagus irregularis]CAB5187718.1 unnamed protein product [Rhizophagus irregularis]CAB5390118.1 unnamed protein product [Rhizophagus irregularis]|eukprot:XP_025188416.1 hypothetical protein GLOIN_2v1763124 [Rhizophagus irregularis DAOM 181602=DAOM 197198]